MFCWSVRRGSDASGTLPVGRLDGRTGALGRARRLEGAEVRALAGRAVRLGVGRGEVEEIGRGVGGKNRGRGRGELELFEDGAGFVGMVKRRRPPQGQARASMS